MSAINWGREKGKGAPFLNRVGTLLEANKLLITVWTLPCLNSQGLILKWKNRAKILMSQCLFLLEHNHWVANNNCGRHWSDDFSGFNLDPDVFHRVHQTSLLWVVLVHTPRFHHLLYQSGYPRGRVSPYCAQCGRFYLCEPQNHLTKSPLAGGARHAGMKGHLKCMKKHTHCGKHLFLVTLKRDISGEVLYLFFLANSVGESWPVYKMQEF